MTVVLLVIAGAVLAGWLRGGSMHALSVVSLPGWPLVFAALGVQLVGAFAAPLRLPGPKAWYVVGMLLSAVLIVAFVARNRDLRGMPLIAAGFLFNALVIVANGAMPVSTEAAARAGVYLDVSGDDAKHEVMTGSTRLRPLADVIPVPMPGGVGANVLSVGDVVLAAGIGVLITNAMLRRERPQGSRRSPANRRTASDVG